MEEGAEAFRSVLEKLFNLAMEMERSEFLGAGPYQRTSERRDHANGFKDKTVATGVGRLKLKIPQVRNLSFYPKSLERGCRSEKALKLAIAEMYVKGVSTRKVSQITEQLCGTEISATQVSRIAKMLDEELEQFRERELQEYRVVYLDAHYEKVSVNGTVQDLAILKALGVNRWGKREVLGVSATLSEAEVHWRKYLQTLQRRGLQGVELVVSDDHVGLRAARRAVFPSVPWQRCQFHLAQNAQAHAHNRAQAREMGQAIRDIFNCPSLAYAEAMVTQVAERFAKENPKWVKWLEENIAEGFTVYRFARSTHRKIRTINGLERVNKVIRRRTRVVGIFPNQDSVLRLTSAVLAEIHEEWLTGRQYLNLAAWSTAEKPASQTIYRKSVA
jgi:transposase-like protein